MGLYGDKLTKTDGAGVDVITKSAGAAFDGLTKSAGNASDNFLYAAPFDNIIKNSFDWLNPVSGIAQGWQTVIGGAGEIAVGFGFTGNAQRVDCYAGSVADLLQLFGGIIDGQQMRLKLKYYLNKDLGLGDLFVYQNPDAATIIVLSASKTLTSVSVDFTATRMNGLYFRLNSAEFDFFIIDEVELYAI